MEDKVMGKLIASLAPDISKLEIEPATTAEEIKARVQSLSPKERAAILASTFEIEQEG